MYISTLLGTSKIKKLIVSKEIKEHQGNSEDISLPPGMITI
jgi:hypothetical protein